MPAIPPSPAMPRQKLRGQAYRRLGLVLLIAAVGILLIGATNYALVQQREHQQREAEIKDYYNRTLPKWESTWYLGATRMRSRIDFIRALEGKSSLRRVAEFIDSQQALSEFSDVAVFDAGRTPLLTRGNHGRELAERTLEGTRWLALPEQGLYRLFQMPLWLEPGGQGRLVLYKRIDDAALKVLAIPQAHLSLEFQDRPVAASDDQPAPQGALHLTFPLSRDADGNAPVLQVWSETGQLVPFWQFALRPLAAILLIALLLAAVLGRWLKQTAQRIERLDRSAQHYAEAGDAAAVVHELEQSAVLPDEIGATAQAMQHLVGAVEARNEEQRVYLETLALLDEAVLEMDESCVIRRASPGWHTLSHQEAGIGRPFYEFIHPGDVTALRGQCTQLGNAEKGQATLRMRLLPANPLDSRDVWVECRLLRSQDRGLRCVLRDITQHYLQERQITEMALHDALTGLPNRVLLEDRIKIAARLADRHAQIVAICFIDLDHFKLVNDTLGHKAGDRLLVALAERLKGQLRVGDTLARWGGDEFVLLLPEMESEQAIRHTAAKVVAALQEPLHLETGETRVTFSMGVAMYPDDQREIETLFSQADRAMFHAKEQGRNQVCFYKDMQAKGLGRNELYIQNRLVKAIQEGRIETWFQPIVDVSSGRCGSVEVLARWHDEEYGDISPATFIPMAENLGLIHELGMHILNSSLAAAREWRDLGHAVPIAVNVSKRQLFIRALPGQLMEAVAAHGLSPADVILEVTESVALSDVEHGADRVRELRQSGFRIAIDDFGTGYSALSQLHELQADELKIDISFVRRLHDPVGLNMVRAIVNLAGLFGLSTVAEGVEDGDTADKLSWLGVDAVQGYHCARPMPRQEFLAWLEAGHQFFTPLSP